MFGERNEVCKLMVGRGQAVVMGQALPTPAVEAAKKTGHHCL